MLRIVENCGFRRWGDIWASRVQGWLGDARKGEAGLSAQTANYYLQAFKGFCGWCVRDRRATESPVRHFDGFNVETDRRHDRRALPDDELLVLLTATAKAPTRFRMTGAERSMLYRLAVSSGLRAGEIRSLTPRSFDLDADPPTVTVATGYSKRRREDVQPLPASIVANLRDYLADRPRNKPAFPMPHPCSVVRMLRRDLRLARARWIRAVADRKGRRERRDGDGLRHRDEAGRVLDFHSFRHTYISSLAAGGVHPKDAQTLARHSTITLTMDR